MTFKLIILNALFLFGFQVLSQEDATPKDRLVVESLVRLNRFDLSKNEKWKAAVVRYTRSLRSKEGYFELVEQFSLVEEVPELIRLAEKDPNALESSQAIKLILQFGEYDKLTKLLFSAPKDKVTVYLKLIGFVKTVEAQKFLESWASLKEPSLASANPVPSQLNSLENIEVLATRTGNIKKGRAVFQKFCFACHKAGDIGIDYGPGLSEIGDKLPKSELILSIVKPNDGISFDYEGWTIETSNGQTFTGIISESIEDVTVRMAGGLKQTIKKKDITKKSKMEISLMPEGLHLAMSENELVDLVEFLSSLRNR